MGEWHNLCSSETCISAFFFRYLAISKLLTTHLVLRKKRKSFWNYEQFFSQNRQKRAGGFGPDFCLEINSISFKIHIIIPPVPLLTLPPDLSPWWLRLFARQIYVKEEIRYVSLHGTQVVPVLCCLPDVAPGSAIDFPLISGHVLALFRFAIMRYDNLTSASDSQSLGPSDRR